MRQGVADQHQSTAPSLAPVHGCEGLVERELVALGRVAAVSRADLLDERRELGVVRDQREELDHVRVLGVAVVTVRDDSDADAGHAVHQGLDEAGELSAHRLEVSVHRARGVEAQHDLDGKRRTLPGQRELLAAAADAAVDPRVQELAAVLGVAELAAPVAELAQPNAAGRVVEAAVELAAAGTMLAGASVHGHEAEAGGGGERS
eukprot:SAG25_NODE_577_length_6782_cov_26.651504_1_plen_205_part_00